MSVTLLQGDYLEIMPTLPAASVDLVLCDLPYGTTQNKWDAIIPFGPMWAAYSAVCKGAVVLMAAQPFTSALVLSNLAGFKYQWVWCKNKTTGFLNAKKQPLRGHEDIVVFYKSQPTYNPQKTPRTPEEIKRMRYCAAKPTDERSPCYGTLRSNSSGGRENGTDKYPDTKLVIKAISTRSVEGGLHPTQKPVALMEYLIRTYTNPGDTVLDNCMGSGTTGVACVNTGRNFIGIEKDPGYFAIAERRIREEDEFAKAMRLAAEM